MRNCVELNCVKFSCVVVVEEKGKAMLLFRREIILGFS